MYTVIYDGACNVCGRAMSLLRRWDRRGRFTILPYQDPAVPALFPAVSAAEFAAAIQLISPGGARWAGAAAIDRLLSEADPAPGSLIQLSVPSARNDTATFDRMTLQRLESVRRALSDRGYLAHGDASFDGDDDVPRDGAGHGVLL